MVQVSFWLGGRWLERLARKVGVAPGKMVRISKMERVGQGPVRWSMLVEDGSIWSVRGGEVSLEALMGMGSSGNTSVELEKELGVERMLAGYNRVIGKWKM